MRITRNTAVVLVTLAFGAVPAVALAGGNGTGKGNSNNAPGHTKSTTSSSTPNSTRAYGRYCRGESKKHVKGQRGTAFSECVVAAAQAAKNPKLTPQKACADLSKKHVKGVRGTAFSTCVKGLKKLRGH